MKFYGNLLVDENSDFSKLEKHLTVYGALISSTQILQVMKDTALRLEESENTLIAHYQFLYKGWDTEWDVIRSSLTWA